MNATAASEAVDKDLARVRALAALRGYAVDAIDADIGGPEFVVSRGALTRRCTTFAELVELLRRMGIAI